VTAPTTASAETVSLPISFTFRQRITLWLITWAGYLAIRAIGPTLRYHVSFEEGAPENFISPPVIYAFWHRCVFPAAYFWRNLGIQVMTSRSFDGEYIARIIQKFGYVAVRGSSHRGAVPALLEMRRGARQGASVAFTIDGPRGPRYVAKPGPVLLSRATGIPMCAFHIALDDAWILNTWDALMIPKPFSRALIRMSSRITVPTEANDSEMEHLHAELQSSLDRVRQFAEGNVQRVSHRDFPISSVT
jgi:lysophospholipid acyltransferase (LPLAT)-like uncharacterized protein